MEVVTLGEGGSERVLQRMQAEGFSLTEAECIQVMRHPFVGLAVGQSMQERSSQFVAFVHTACHALFRQLGRTHAIAPKCYAHLSSSAIALADRDSRWRKILEPDDTGFRGFTSYTMLVVRSSSPKLYAPEGLKGLPAGSLQRGSAPVDSAVVCFESSPPEDGGELLHSLVAMGAGNAYIVPPLAMLEVVDVHGPGEWEYLPGQRIYQQLITVRPTLRCHMAASQVTPTE